MKTKSPFQFSDSKMHTLQRSERFFNFNKEFHGYRFECNGIVYDKFEMFYMVENNVETIERIKSGISKYKMIKSEYHKKILTT